MPLANYAFIDSQNLNLAIRAQGWKLDFARFRVYLRDKYKVEKAFLFIGYVSGNERLYAVPSPHERFTTTARKKRKSPIRTEP